MERKTKKPHVYVVERYTEEQRTFIIERYFKNNGSLQATVRNFRTKYGINSELCASTVKRLVQKYKETGSVEDIKSTGRPSTLNIEAVRKSIAKNPKTSIRCRAQELGISRSSLHKILKKILPLESCSVQLKPTDSEQQIELIESKEVEN